MADFRKIDSSGNLILGGILANELPVHGHTASEISDFNNQVQEDTKNLICCKQVIYQEDLSGYPTGTAIADGDKIYGDPCYYFRVKMEASVSIERNDNDQNYDFKNEGVFVCFLTKSIQSDPWTIARAIRITDFDNEKMFIDYEFLTTTSDNLYVSIYLSTSGIDEGMNITPISNLGRFIGKLTVKKCPKASWFHRFTLSDSGWVSSPTAVVTGTLPTTGSLPFIGFYHVDFYAQVRESLTIYGDDVNVTGSQSLEIREQGGTYLQLDRSGIFTPGVPNEGEKWMNRALQGSCILEITNTSNKLEYKLTLPNGMQRKLEGGYVHIKYIGSAESISL